MASIAQDLELGGRRASRGRLGLVLFWCLAIAALLAAAMVAGRLARERAADLAAQRAAEALPLAVASLAASIEKQRLIPMVFARDPEVIALLAAPANRARDLLNAKLADIAREADASVIYLIGPDGRAIAASNADTPQSFVGSDYSFRTYFTRAMAEGSAQQYGLGTVSLRPGLYLSHRVDGWKGPLGVVVVKVEFESLEARWRDSGLTVFVTDPSGVVLITTDPALRFGSAHPVADEAAARAALQIGDMPMPRVPLVEQGDGRALLAGQTQATASGPVGPSAPGWRLAVFQPTGAALARAAGYAARAADGARGDEPGAGAACGAAHRGAEPHQRGAGGRDRRARERRGARAPSARRTGPGQPAVDPRPGLGRGGPRDQPAGRGDPRLCRDRQAADRRRPCGGRPRQPARDRRSGSARSPRACGASRGAARATPARSGSMRRWTGR
jgi:hypothetical protein